jgi:hypothetical protein
VEDAIPVPHGFDLFPVPMSRQTQETRRINAVRLSKHFPYRTAVGLSRLSTPATLQRRVRHGRPEGSFVGTKLSPLPRSRTFDAPNHAESRDKPGHDALKLVRRSPHHPDSDDQRLTRQEPKNLSPDPGDAQQLSGTPWTRRARARSGEQKRFSMISAGSKGSVWNFLPQALEGDPAQRCSGA